MKKEIRESVYKKFDGRCAYCGEEIEYKDMQVDHIIPKSFFTWHIRNSFKVPKFLRHLTEYDFNHIDNLYPSCRVCNNWKGVFDIETFRGELHKQPERLSKNSSGYRIAKRYNLVSETHDPVIFYFEEA